MYLFACCIVALLASFRFLYLIWGKMVQGADPLASGPFFLGLLFLMAPAFLMCAPIFSTAFTSNPLSGNHSQPVTLSDGTISVVLSLIGALGVLATAVAHGVRHRHQPGFWRVGRLVISALSAGVVVIATVSQLTFSLAPNSGLVFALRNDSLPKDVHCTSHILLIQWDGSISSPVVYRCPTGYLFNLYTRRPFAPWPDYMQGSSIDLAAQLYQFEQDDEKQGGATEATPAP